MSDIVIRAENLGKSYLIGHNNEESYTTLRDVLSNKVLQFSRKTKQVLHGNQIVHGSELEVFWALKDIDFEIKQGDRLGIIGSNGAGKSTLLKVISRITNPTTGTIQIKGRITSLLEVGTGFHPELTGRENIFLNGAILGMKKQDIKSKFDEIIDFSGVEKFLDTPVKRYSSGMYVRLAFSVAAHLDSEILIIDEVLAVGDAEFQKKCLGKMDSVSKKSGRTILFVSHNMAAIMSLCSSALLLNNGRITHSGTPGNIISNYLNDNAGRLDNRDFSNMIHREGDGNLLRLLNYDIVDNNGNSLINIPCGKKVHIEINFQVLTEKIDNLRIGINFTDISSGKIVTELNSYYGSSEKITCGNGTHKYQFIVDRFPLGPNQYNVGFIATTGLHILDWIKNVSQINVIEGLFYKSGQMPIEKNSQIFFTEYECGFITNL